MKPFDYGCVVTGEMFCPRPEMEETLSSYMKCGQNVVVVGERRIGKTSLIMSSFSKIKGYQLLYVDLLNIRTISDFCNKVASAASRAIKDGNFIQKAITFLSHLRPTLSLDPQSGMPVISVDSRIAENLSSLEDIVAMIESMAGRYKLVVVFDEFQEMLKLDDSDKVLATLRSKIQFLSQTCFVFSGSVRRDMVRIFTDYKSPFYKSAATLNVTEIDDDDFIAFLQKRFTLGDRKANKEFLLNVLSAANRISGDVQQLCDAVWRTSQPGAELTDADLSAGIEQILKQDDAAFAFQTAHLTRYQMKALMGVARFGGKHVFSAEFVSNAGLSSAPTAKRAFDKLVELGILYCHQKEYKIFNPFLAEWLKRS